MYQGETVTTTIHDLPIPTSVIQDIYLVYRTATKTVLEKSTLTHKDDFEVEEYCVSCTITQEESLKLPCGPLYRSFIFITTDGSRIERVNDELVCGKTAKREVL